MALTNKKLAVVIMCCLMAGTALGACVGDSNPPVNKPPIAKISSPASGSVFDTGVTITFDGSTSRDPEKKPLGLNWSFGDGINGTGNVTTHSYALPGKYSVTLQVSDGKKKATDRIELNISQANRAPVVRLSASKLNASNEELVELNATGTTDADNDTLSFSWNLGDNTTAQGPVVTHLYPGVGVYNVTLNVSDGKTWSAAALAINIYQANRPPVPVVFADPPVAFLNASVKFDASASTDADNDTLSASWDFGDGQNATGMVVNHGFGRVGNFTAVANVTDGRLSRTSSVVVTIVPRARILVDWNGTDYGYMVQLDADAGAANLSVTVSSSAGAIDNSSNITALGKRDFGVKTTVTPVKGLVLTVSARYWGNPIGSRKLTIYENSAMPGTNCTLGMNASINELTITNGTDSHSQEWFNISGEASIVVRGGTGNYSMRISKGSSDSSGNDSDNNTHEGKSTLAGWYNMTFDWGTQLNKSIELRMSGNSTTRDPDGKVLGNMSAETVQKALDHNTTFQGQQLTLRQYPVNYSILVETLGIEDKANGNGVVFSCLKLRSNLTADAVVDIMGTPVHIKLFNETIRWDVRDDRYTNSTIFMDYVQNGYIVNDTSGEWTVIPDSTGSGSKFLDDNNDGKYNPDPAAMSMDELFTFKGPMPRELLVGDRISGTNLHGVKVVVEVTENGLRTVEGVNYKVVHVKSTFTSQSGNATGSSDNWVVSDGNLTGLPIESNESKTWKESEEKTTVSTSSIRSATIRED